MGKWLDSVKELLALYFALVLICAGGFAYVEHKTYVDALWWACATATTVGYGDMYPATLAGKIIAAFLMHASVLFVLPLLIGSICSRIVKNQHEFTHQEQEEIKASLGRLEARFDERFSTRPRAEP